MRFYEPIDGENKMMTWKTDVDGKNNGVMYENIDGENKMMTWKTDVDGKNNGVMYEFNNVFHRFS